MSLTSYRAAPPRVTMSRLRNAAREPLFVDRFAMQIGWRAAPPRVTIGQLCGLSRYAAPNRAKTLERKVPETQKGPAKALQVRAKALTCEWVFRPRRL